MIVQLSISAYQSMHDNQFLQTVSALLHAIQGQSQIMCTAVRHASSALIASNSLILADAGRLLAC